MASAKPRRRWRLIRRIALALLLLVAVAIGALLIALHTDWGRAKVRDQIAETLDDTFTGGVEIGALEGSVLGELVLRDVVIRDADGRNAIVIERLEFGVGLTELARKRVALDDVTAEGVTIDARYRDGRLNLADLIRQNDAASTWEIEIAKLSMRDARIVIDADGKLAHIDAVTASGRVSMLLGAPISVTLEVTGHWRERDTAIALSGTVDRSNDTTALTAAKLEVGGGRIDVPTVTIAGSGIAGELALAVPDGELGKWLPTVGTSPPISMRLRARPAPSGAIGLELDGSVAGTKLTGSLNLSTLEDGARIAGKLALSQLDLAEFVPSTVATALDTTLDVDLAIHPARLGLDRAAGTIAFAGRGSIGSATLDDASATVTIARGQIALDGRARGLGAHLEIEARGGLRDDGAIELVSAHLVARATDLQRASMGNVEVEGAVQADLVASGVIRDGVPELTIAGHVTGADLHVANIDVTHARIDLDLAGTPQQPTGTAKATIRGANFSGTPLELLVVTASTRGDRAFATTIRSRGVDRAIGPWSARADAMVRILDRGGAAISLGDHLVRARGIEATGRGGAIAVDDTQLRAIKLRTKLAGGTLVIDGRYAIGGRSAGDFDARVVTTALDLTALDRRLRISGELEGNAILDLELRRRRGTLSGSASGTLTGARALRSADPIDVTFRSTVSSLRLALELTARGDHVGGLFAAVEITPPRRIADLAAWARLERSSIDRLELRADALRVDALARTIGRPGLARGLIDASLLVTPIALHGSIRGRGLVTAALPEAIDLDVDLESSRTDQVTAKVRATVHTIARGSMSIAARLPPRPFDLDGWARLDASAVHSLSARIDEIAIDERLATRFGLPGDWRGRVAVAVEVPAGLTSATAKVTARDVVGRPFVRPVGGTVVLALDQAGLHATLQVDNEQARLASADIRIAIAPPDLLRLGMVAVRRAAITGRAQITSTEIAPLLAMLDERRRPRARGTVRAELDLRGTVGAPELVGEVVITEVGWGRRVVLRELRIDGRYANRTVIATARGRQDSGGRLEVASTLGVDNLDAAVTTLSASKFDVGLLARITGTIGASGTLDGELRVRGVKPEVAAVDGRLTLRDAGLPLTDELGALHDAVIELDLRGTRAQLRARGKIESGDVEVRADATLDGLVPDTAVVDITATDLSLITASAPRVSGTLHADVTRRDGRWVVDAEITSGRVIVPKEPGRVLHPSGIPSTMVMVDGEIPPPQGPSGSDAVIVSRPVIEIALRIQPVEVTSEQFRGRVRGALEIVLGTEGIAMAGNVEVVRGDVVLFERRFRIDRAAVRFDGGVDPLLNIRLVYDFPQLTLRVAVTGRLSDPKLALTSDRGGYNEAQLLGFLVGGAPGDQSGPARDDAARDVATAAVAQVVGRYVGKLVPVRIDVLRYEAATSARSGALTIGRRFSDRLFLSWRNRVDARPDENTGEALLEYWLGRRVLLEGVVGNEGVHGIDMLWTRRW